MTASHHYLLDGAMMNGIDSHLPAGQAMPAWLHPLADRDDPGAPFGAVLLDPLAAREAGQQDLVETLCTAVPSSLHLSMIASTLTTAQMRAHLRQFSKILLGDREVFFLRFSDCRVLLVLSTVLTPGQWRALTAPMARWDIHLRDGSRRALPLGAADVAPTPPAWILDGEQLAACMEAEEADILLSQLGFTLDSMRGNIHRYWDTARRCVASWQQYGAGNRQQLFNIARRVFQPDGEELREKDLEAMFLANPAPDSVHAGGGSLSMKEDTQ
ncbi:DUF4123 domain-containing protein [Janthinobacterium sp.]|uniref:DUF4123 domain-containing protein n=1 Tax=Janthinobacterium sp. TaxID=1871054 RepID=UPI00293D841A|nr:DUF4123 domain-containing protein [Janthinobacterium sp.]